VSDNRCRFDVASLSRFFSIGIVAVTFAFLVTQQRNVGFLVTFPHLTALIARAQRVA